MRVNDKPLHGRHILVVEDEYLIADDLRRTLRQLGADVVGPASTLTGAMKLAAGRTLDCAILDINLDGDLAFPLAQQLEDAHVPVIVATGYDETFVGGRFHAAAVLEKPCSPERLSRAVMDICGNA